MHSKVEKAKLDIKVQPESNSDKNLGSNQKNSFTDEEKSSKVSQLKVKNLKLAQRKKKILNETKNEDKSLSKEPKDKNLESNKKNSSEKVFMKVLYHQQLITKPLTQNVIWTMYQTKREKWKLMAQ